MTKQDRQDILFAAIVLVLLFVTLIGSLKFERMLRDYQSPQSGCVSNISRSECT